jgi:uncharacterized membrane protein YfcA
MILELMLFICGIAIASVATAIGIGSGILWMPLLILGYGLSPQDGSGTIAFYRAGLVNIRLSLIFVVVALPGVIIGSFILVNLSQQIIQMTLGVMSMMLAILFVASRDDAVENSTRGYLKKELVTILPIPAFFGFFMGSLSLGISEWLIPALRHRLKMEMIASIAVVIPMMFLLALSASLIHGFHVDKINWSYFAWGSVGTLIGGQLGVQISRRINEYVLKQGFIYLMTLIGIHLIFQAI